MAKLFFTEEFGKAFVPARVLPHLRKYLLRAGISQTPYRFFGVLFYLCLGITIGLYLAFINAWLQQAIQDIAFLSSFGQLSLLLLSFLAVFGLLLFLSTLIILLVYFYLDILIFRRTKEMEENLPDYLQIVGSNLRGGLTFEAALWAAIKPRFQILGDEMAEVAKKVMTGYPVNRALSELSEKYDSPMLRRSIDLIISEMESGGNIADLLERIVDHLKETRTLKKEMSAAAVSYVMFISVIVIVISPLLFSLAYNLLVVILGFIENLSSATQRVNTLPFSLSTGSVNPNDFRIFAVSTICVISFFASLIVSIVEKGSIKGGLKYIPLFFFGSLGFYFFFMKVLTSLFSGIV
ncbi:MAG TPA: type II secretion system F family protein [Candidatus Nanoarchaeia archaeon]|nr:type II secretion system F family protein [Candidatus Nanoarchaeia archaeon]